MRAEKHFNGFLFVLGIALPLVWILDAPWINDEPMLFNIALDAIEKGGWAQRGLQGTFGAYYGPLPARLYQTLLYFTSNIGIIAFLKIAISVASTVLCFVALIRKGVFPKSSALLLLFSPYLFFYHRILWDNCFLIPLSLFWFLMVVAWFDKPSPWKLVVLGASFAMGLEIHLMSVLTIIPLAGLILFTQRKPMTFLSLFGGGILGLLPAFSYWMAVPKVFLANAPTPERWRAEQLLVVIGGARWFTTIDYFDHYIPEVSRWMIKHSSAFFYYLLISPSLLIMYWYVKGLFEEARRWYREKNRRGERESFLFLLFALPLLCHLLFFNFSPKGHHPHYYNVCWVSFLYFIGCSIHRAKNGSKLVTLYSLYLLIVVGATLSWVHHFRGSREFNYGTTLRNQKHIVRQRLALAPEVSVEFKNRQYQQFPHAFTALERLEKRLGVVPVSLRGSHPLSKISIDYLFPESEKNAKLILKFEQATGP